MASYLYIGSEKGLRARIAPANGGMVSQITYHGKDILFLNEDAIETAPMAAGGMPILFPFPSKTRNDEYALDGVKYRMPMHGLLKNDVFFVESAGENSVVLWTENSPARKAGYYPFDYRLTVTYRAEGDTLYVTTKISNLSDRPLPHYLGWHPFFKSTDKKRIRLKNDMQIHYDYGVCKDDEMPDMSDLSKRWDDVIHTPKTNSFVLDNEADGYSVKCDFDKEFRVIVVCSWLDGCVCVEPWCGLPDSINQNRFIEYVPAGESKEYSFGLTVSDI